MQDDGSLINDAYNALPVYLLSAVPMALLTVWLLVVVGVALVVGVVFAAGSVVTVSVNY